MAGRSQFIHEHAVCWEIAPRIELKDGQFLPIGFELRLHAQSARIDPSSAEAREMYAALREIALEANPMDARLEIEPYDAAIRFRHETGWAAEVDLRAEIRRPKPTLERVDDDDRERARALAAALRKLGVPEGVYRSAA